MKHASHIDDPVERLLKENAPPPGRPDTRRVARACDAVGRLPRAAAPVLSPRLFVRPLLRLAAGLAVAAGIALLYPRGLRDREPQTVTAPAIASVSVPEEYRKWVGPDLLTDTLTTESANLVADLTTLTAVLNERTFAILF